MESKVREQWIEVAGMLGGEVNAEMVPGGYTVNFDRGALAACRYPLLGKRTIALLHGLACLECNGSVTASDHPDIWFYSCKAQSGSTDTHPGAILKMLRAYREGK